MSVKTWTEWLKKSRFSYLNDEQKEQTMRWLGEVRDKILTRADIQPGDVLLDIGTGTGLLAFGAYDILKNSGKIIASDIAEDCLVECKKIADACGINDMEFIHTDINGLKLDDSSVDVAVTRSVLVHIQDKLPAVKEIYRILKPGGRISIFEPIISSNTKTCELINPDKFTDYDEIREIEAKIMTDKNDPLTNFDEKVLINAFELAGFKNIDLDLSTEKSVYKVTADMIDPWYNTPPSPGTLTMKQKLLRYLSEEKIDNFIAELKQELDGQVIEVKSFSAYIRAVR